MAGPRSYSDVGSVPGTYRIIDLFCLKEVFNQIMRCSCNSDQGFAIYQSGPEEALLSFHSVLDIMCRNCRKKISFGTSTILGSDHEADMEPDVDIKMEKVLEDPGLRTSILVELYQTVDQPTNQGSRIDPTENYSEADQRMRTEFVENPDICDLVVSYGGDSVYPQKIHKTLDQRHTKAASKSRFQCDVCSRIFTKQHNLKEHMRIHTGERLVCDYENCDKTFNDKSSLNKHLKAVHLHVKNHSCDICDKRFTRLAHLKEHMVVHSKEKKFECPECFKRFPFQSTMSQHLRMHTAGKSFKCELCGKFFKGKKSLKSHVSNIHRLDGSSMPGLLMKPIVSHNTSENFLS